jgi:CHAT domain-containing protein/tetratricopeptide (TPR) repeat protein
MRAWAAVAAVLLAGAVALAQESPVDGGAEARQAEYESLCRESRELQREARYEELLPKLRQVLAMERERFGDVHEEVRGTLAWIARTSERLGRIDEARESLRAALGIAVRLYGESHWRVGDTRRALSDLDLRSRMTEEQRAELLEAGGLAARASRLRRAGRPREALPLAERSLRIRGRLLGEEHPDYASGLYDLAVVYHWMCEYSKAEPLYRRAVEIRREALGEMHPDHAVSLNNLAYLYLWMGEYAKAEPLYRQAMEIIRSALGEEHPRYPTSLDNLAILYDRMGRYARAEPLYRQALAIRRKTVGEEHPDYAVSLNGLAALYHSLGEYARAESLYLQAIEICRKVASEDHPRASLASGRNRLATSLHNLAALYRSMGQHARAEPLLRQAVKIYGESLGEEHPRFATSLDSLAALYRSMGEDARAEPLIRQAMEIRRKTLGEEHPRFAVSLGNLAALFLSRGEHARAEPLFRQALEIRRKALGEEHPHVAASLGRLAAFYGSWGEYGKAEPLCRQALEIQRALLDETFAVLSERQQVQMSCLLRETLDLYLSLSLRTDRPPEEVYAPLLAWKGAVLERQIRAHRLAEIPDTAGLLRELESASRRLATLSLHVPEEPQRAAWRRQIAELRERRELLERKLSRRSGGDRRALVDRRPTPAELREALPGGVALVDVVEYRRASGRGNEDRRDVRPEAHLVAFVVRPEAEIRRIELGPTEPIAAAIDVWRLTARKLRRSDAGQTLRRLVWEPLVPHLGGAQTVLVSPEGPLHRLPFGALPGKAPGTHLVAEVAVAAIPVPRLLCALLADTASVADPGLLLVGDVAYGGSPGGGDAAGLSAAGTIAGALPAFPRLDSTRAEIAAIRDSYELRQENGEVRVLRRAGATEEAFRREAGRCRWLHVATHGFFAPEGLRSALGTNAGGISAWGREERAVGYHPGLLSGLALSGANTPPEGDGDDGILTALEVAALDLSNVEVAVLSACETGLGEVAAGEGVMGLQRAFQVAGARTTVTSLWKVPDVATQLLMQRFYENLWDKGMGKLEALRQAQLWLMREGGQRGVMLPEESRETESKHLPPYFWAAFVLSGDWR